MDKPKSSAGMRSLNGPKASLAACIVAMCITTCVLHVKYSDNMSHIRTIGYNTIAGSGTNTSSNVSLSDRSTKDHVIVLWTPEFWSANWHLGKLGRGVCGYNNCIVTRDRAYGETADILLFSCRNKYDKPLPKRDPRQIYVLHCNEPPAFYSMKWYKNIVNMTISYRPDSDVSIPHFKVGPRDKPKDGPYISKIPFSGRNYSVSWMVGRCKALSRRQEYIAILSKYIPTDIYGKCGRRLNGDAMAYLERNYMFYFAGENNICPHYVTEKLSRTLKYDLVPIVLGGVNYSQVAPPHSYINVLDYKSPKELAEYLKYLSQNETAYNQYFQWKQTYEIEPHLNRFCEMCKIMNEGRFHRDAWDVDAWWGRNNGICSNHIVKPLLKG